MTQRFCMSSMTPQEIVSELDNHIVGQASAKRAVAIALRNRWRRQQVPDALRHEITPKNILMIGPTGVGKTEIARRLARLADAPFIKVEATKFTEVGYVGRDVESIVRDEKKIFPCCVSLEGEYGQNDICIGVPVILGKNGIEKIVELELTADEKAKFAASAAAVHKTNAALKEVGAL